MGKGINQIHILNSDDFTMFVKSSENRHNEIRMTNVYRIYPTLWNEGICQMAQTIYAIDRQPPANTFPTCCSRRTEKDPAYYWDAGTFQRLLPPPDTNGACCQPAVWNAVNWQILPSWLSYVQTLGYTVTTDLSRLKPYTDIYISGP